MDITKLSDRFCVRRLYEKDVEQIYFLSCGNALFYEYHPPFVTRESILEDMAALPPGKSYEDKFYFGFFEGETLVAVMDLIRDFPEKMTVFIGLFMMNPRYQGQGVGSKIIGECISRIQKWGYRSVRLGVDIGNPQSLAFWRKNGFTEISEDQYIVMERTLSE